MDVMNMAWGYVVPFLVLLTVLVFVHEWGHFIVARMCGVRVEVFSIGFGPEVFGFTAKSGTRWKFSAVPLGGYVKMFGESNPVSEGRDPRTRLTEDQRSVSFYAKPLRHRAAIVFAGPAANYLFAILVSAIIVFSFGEPFTPADIGKVMPGGAAERAGLKAGDVIKEIDGAEIERFQDIQMIIRMSPGIPLEIKIERDGNTITKTVTPEVKDEPDDFGNPQRIGQLGIQRTMQDRVIVEYNPFEALWRGTIRTVDLTGSIFKGVAQIISGTRTTKELGGPLRIAKLTGDVWQLGIGTVLNFAVLLSINLALINLVPIPMLDGGHLMFYACEAIRGKPLGERATEYGFRIGIALVLALMVFVTWNDLVQMQVIDFFVNLVT